MCLLGFRPSGSEVSLLGLQVICWWSVLAKLDCECSAGEVCSLGLQVVCWSEVCLLGSGWSAGEVCLLGSRWSARAPASWSSPTYLLGLNRRGWSNCQRTNLQVSYVVHATLCMAMADSLVVQHNYILAARSCCPCSSRQADNKWACAEEIQNYHSGKEVCLVLCCFCCLSGLLDLEAKLELPRGQP